jgi:hypothetical protein
MSYLNSIPYLETENLSGLTLISLIRVPDVLQFPDSYNGIATSAIIFKEGKGWSAWAATYRTSSFSRRAQDTQEGVLTNQELPFIIPRYTPAITSMLRLAERDEFIILFKDANGQEYLWGNPQKPVRFLFDQSTGSGSGRNQYECKFYSESSENILAYPVTFGTVPADPNACRPVVIRRGSSTGPVLAVAAAGSTVIITSPYSFGYELAIT